MATPSLAEARTQVVNGTHTIEEIRELAEADATNLLGLIDTDEQAAEGDHNAGIIGSNRIIRSAFNSLLTRGAIARHMEPRLRHWAKAAGISEAESSIREVVDRLRQYMVDTSAARISSRQFTYGAPAAGGGNVGDGVLYRLTKDQDNFDLEAARAEVKSLRCIRDQSSGAFEHEEVFEVRGEDPAIDFLELLGSGPLGNLRARSTRTSRLTNPSFSLFSGTTAVPTAITGYTVNTIGNCQIDQANIFKDHVGDTTPASLRLDGAIIVSQALSVRNTQLINPWPYYLGIGYNRSIGTGTGTLRIRLGSQTVTVATLSTAGAGWNILALPRDTNSWFENFNEQDLDITVELEASGEAIGGFTLVDNFDFHPFIKIGGTFYLLVGGATPFLVNDTFSVTDTEAATGVIQRTAMWRGFDDYLAHSTGGGITIADP
jgi:hypothetical protein